MSTSTTKTTQKAQPVRNVQAYIAAAMIVITALGGISWATHPDWSTILATLLPALGAAYAAYQAKALPEKVVPVEDTAVYVDQDGNSVAGPASPLPNGTPAVSADPNAAPDPAPADDITVADTSDTKSDAATYNPQHGAPE